MKRFLLIFRNILKLDRDFCLIETLFKVLRSFTGF